MRPHGSRNKVMSPNAARGRAWQSMRVLRRFTLPQLEATAGISRANAKWYVLRLRFSGHVRLAQANISGRAGSHALYQLVRDSGPQAPIACVDGHVYDPNLDQYFGEARDGDDGLA